VLIFILTKASKLQLSANKANRSASLSFYWAW